MISVGCFLWDKVLGDGVPKETIQEELNPALKNENALYSICVQGRRERGEEETENKELKVEGSHLMGQMYNIICLISTSISLLDNNHLCNVYSSRQQIHQLVEFSHKHLFPLQKAFFLAPFSLGRWCNSVQTNES